MKKDEKTSQQEPMEMVSVHTLETVATITGVSVEVIQRYCEYGLVAPVNDAAKEELKFDDEALRALRRIEHLRAASGANLRAVKMILDLMEEVERLRAELRFLR